MGINHPQRGTQRRPGEASFWADEPTEAALSLIEENALRADERTLWSDEHADGVHSLLE
jgi:hypothetical protein